MQKLLIFMAQLKIRLELVLYEFSNSKNNESVNGILSIGKAMEGSEIIIVDEKNQILPFEKKENYA